MAAQSEDWFDPSYDPDSDLDIEDDDLFFESLEAIDSQAALHATIDRQAAVATEEKDSDDVSEDVDEDEESEDIEEDDRPAEPLG